MKRADRAPLYLIPLAATIVVLPLVLHGPSYGHDILFHLLSWMEAARQFSHGTLHLRWAYSPAYNAGEPRFVFYPPLSWALGAVLGLVLTHLPGLTPEAGWSAVSATFIWISLTVTGFCMYRAAYAFTSRNAALIAAVVYMANPYMLFTAYERSAYGELLAAAWMPLLLLAMLAPRLRFTRVAVPVALLWLTNVPAAVIGCYAVAFLAVLRAVTALRERETEPSAPMRWLAGLAVPAAGLLLGGLLAGFYLIPAVWERRFVQVSMATIGGSRIDQNFLFEHTGTSNDSLMHDTVLRTASWVAVGLLLGSAVLLVIWRTWRRANRSPEREAVQPRRPTAWLFCLVGTAAFLLSSWSNPTWQHLPAIALLQFPWRLLILVAPVGAIAAGGVLSEFRLNRRSVTGIELLAVMLLTLLVYRPFHQVADPDETVHARLEAFQQQKGADPTDEYSPQGADNDALVAGRPGYWVGDTAIAPAPLNGLPAPTPAHFDVAADHAEYLILNLREYPAWRVQVNGHAEPRREPREDGLISIPILPGRSSIDVQYARLPDETAGAAATVGSCLLLAVVFVRQMQRREPAS